jgi:hypothetical protein
MTTTINLHHISGMRADKALEPGTRTAWLTIFDGRGNTVNVFMPHDMAEEIADLWDAMNREPEPPTFDEALAAKFGREALNDEAMRVKGMVE